MKYLYLFAILVCCAFTTQAQNYKPMPVSNYTWMVRHGNGENWPTYYFYGMKSGDTVINNLTYHKVYRSSDTAFDESEYFAALREDVVARRVYCYDYRIHMERMLYDFSVNVGDTVSWTQWSSVDPFYVVRGTIHSIDSVQINGLYHREIRFSLFNMSTVWQAGSWVEGVGNLNLGGFYKSATGMATCDCADKIVCLKEGNQWIYHNPEYNLVDCDVPTLGISETIAAEQLNVYPNPAANTLTVHGSGQLTITNIYGAVMKKMDINNTATINLNGLVPGTYQLQLRDGRRMASGRFVKE